MKKLFLVLSFLLALQPIFSQTKYKKEFYLISVDDSFEFDASDKHDIDSILKLYHASKNDTTRLFYVRLFAEGLSNEYLWTRYNRYLFEITKDRQDSLHLFYYGCALNNIGYESQYIKNDLELAKQKYHEAYQVFKRINNGGGLGVEINNLAYIYQHEGNLQKAVDLYLEAGEYFEKNDQGLGLTSIYINLGDIYFSMAEYKKAEEYFQKALPLALKTDQRPVLGNVYNQLGAINNQNKKYTEALDYFNKALALYQKEKIYGKVALICVGISNVYQMQHKEMEYESYLKKALENVVLTSDKQTKSKVYDHLASMYIYQKKYELAFPFADSAYRFASELGYKDLMAASAESLGKIFAQRNQFDKAYTYLAEAKLLSDSLKSDETRNAAIKSQFQLEYNKKSIELKAEQDKKDAIRENERKQQQMLLGISLLAIAIISVFAFIAFRNYKLTQKQNKIIEAQKHEVEEKNIEVTRQKVIVEEKQREIIDSITYAKRIQQAVLTGPDVWKQVAQDYFIFFKPKDIVSGDFYWAYSISETTSLIVLADSTGHGVPGAFMSMLGNSFLNEVIIENKVYEPALILEKLRSKIIKALVQQGNTQQKDGMDMSICKFNKVSRELEFAGANNPVWISTDQGIVELKADKMPVGLHAGEQKEFTSQKILLNANDIVFLITDGYADQFGGPQEKKFKYKPLKELMQRNRLEPLYAQGQLLERTLADWSTGFEQVDDVSIIGFKA